MKIRIIVPANTADFNESIKNAVLPVLPPDVSIDVANITEGQPHIENRSDAAINAPYVMQLAAQTEAEGFDGIFVSDFDFCGVEPSRENINIPIIGGFRPSALTAISLSQKIGVVTIVDSVVAMQEEHFRNFGILNNLACIIPTNIPVEELSDTQKVIEVVHEKAKEAISQGAESIILGCTGFIGIAEPVSALLKNDGYNIPVVDPNQAGVTFTIMLVRNKLMQSRLTYYSTSDSR